MMNSFRTVTRCIILRKKVFTPRLTVSFEHLSRQMSQFRKNWGANKEALWSEDGRKSSRSDPFDRSLRKEDESKKFGILYDYSHLS